MSYKPHAATDHLQSRLLMIGKLEKKANSDRAFLFHFYARESQFDQGAINKSNNYREIAAHSTILNGI